METYYLLRYSCSVFIFLSVLYIWLDKSEIYIVALYILDSLLRMKSHPNRFEEPQVWGEVSQFALRNNSRNFHMVLKRIWHRFLSWWREVRCLSCFILGRGAWPIIGWVWNTIVLWKKCLDHRKVSLLDLIADFSLRFLQICRDYYFGSENLISHIVEKKTGNQIYDDLGVLYQSVGVPRKFLLRNKLSTIFMSDIDTLMVSYRSQCWNITWLP